MFLRNEPEKIPFKIWNIRNIPFRNHETSLPFFRLCYDKPLKGDAVAERAKVLLSQEEINPPPSPGQGTLKKDSSLVRIVMIRKTAVLTGALLPRRL